MEFLQSLLENSNLPVLTAFILGLLTAVSPCPLATNITAIGFISKDIQSRNRIFWSGILYTKGDFIHNTWFYPYSHSARRSQYVCHSESNK
jgi:cytochrome c biogenesis protein CcdA